MSYVVRRLIARVLGYSMMGYGYHIVRELCRTVAMQDQSYFEQSIEECWIPNRIFIRRRCFRSSITDKFLFFFVKSIVFGHFWCDDFKHLFVSHRNLRQATRFMTIRCFFFFTRYGTRVRSRYVSFIFNKLPECMLETTTKRNLKKKKVNIKLY